VVERLPRKHKALGSVPSSEKKNQKKKKVSDLAACSDLCLHASIQSLWWRIANLDHIVSSRPAALVTDGECISKGPLR